MGSYQFPVVDSHFHETIHQARPNHDHVSADFHSHYRCSCWSYRHVIEFQLLVLAIGCQSMRAQQIFCSVPLCLKPGAQLTAVSAQLSEYLIYNLFVFNSSMRLLIINAYVRAMYMCLRRRNSNPFKYNNTCCQAIKHVIF